MRTAIAVGMSSRGRRTDFGPDSVADNCTEFADTLIADSMSATLDSGIWADHSMVDWPVAVDWDCRKSDLD